MRREYKMPYLFGPEELKKVFTANGTALSGRIPPLRRPHRNDLPFSLSNLRARCVIAWRVFKGQYDAVTWEK